MTLCVCVVMSLEKAAEVLSKVLRHSENRGESHLVKSVRSLPPILPSQNDETKFSQKKVKKLDFFSAQLNELPEDIEVKICSNEQVSTINTISEADSPASRIYSESHEPNLTVVSLLQGSHGLPFIGKIFTLEDGSERLGSLTNLEVDEFAPLDPSKYKTELCRSYQVHGYCKYGIRCNYAHGVTQIRIAYRHGKYKTRNCQSYHETGFCRYGARCSFIHDAEEGIMKCPITDREVLEALHYRPMSEFRHIATITWRMLENDSYTPTEVHFFTPSVRTNSEDLSIDTHFLTGLCESYTSLDLNSSVEENLLQEDLSLEAKEDFKIENKGNEFEICLCNESRESNSFETEYKDISTFQIAKRNSETTSTNVCFTFQGCTICEEFSRKNENDRNVYKPENKDINKDYKGRDNIVYENPHKKNARNDKTNDKNKPLWRKNINNSIDYPKYSTTFKKFNLEDFLNCLKTREGLHHLASWSSEVERNCKVKDNLPNPPTVDLSCKRQTIRSGRDLSKYKTELCRSYQYNKYCEYDEACLYAHGTEDLRSYPKHPLYRTKKCFSFHKKGFCLYGSRCQFLHDSEIPLLH
ncbi:UNVERIFIED_CONTAM: hypothetical protein RMT77_008493 [Armadillidium vulgare]